MKEIEKKIAHLVKTQFPDFYQEEGPTFVAFVQAYFEWMEQFNLPGEDSFNHIYQARSLPSYRDIDTTLEDFLVHFKEKYLKNIQFDTATNKPLLVKNAMDLYRSKGTERSIDLFFKLVYGTDSEVSYPSENIFRLSDGVWEKPVYLEVAPNKYNINYVGKQIIGAHSGAKAFVERYIKRKTRRGYADILYISNLEGEFINNETIGINVNNVPTFHKDQTTKVLGSAKTLEIINKGSSFEIGDLVELESENRGLGGIARVANTSSQSGVVTFNYNDGGYGYSLDANAIISEKVITATDINANEESMSVLSLFEEISQPNINIAFSSATGTISAGDLISRWDSGDRIAVGRVLSVSQNGDMGSILVNHRSGVFVDNETYYVGANVSTFTADSIEDRTVCAKVMGLTNNYIVTINSASGTFEIGDRVQQGSYQNVAAYGVVLNVDGDNLVLRDTNGIFKDTSNVVSYFYTSGNGTITTNTSSRFVTGTSTDFGRHLLERNLYANTGNTIVGRVRSVINATSLELYSNASIAVAANTYAHSGIFKLYDANNTSKNADIVNVRADIGVYDIQRHHHSLTFVNANNDSITKGINIYQYSADGEKIASGRMITISYSANTGEVTFIPTYGRFVETIPIYVDANVTVATVNTISREVSGGDFSISPYSKIYSSNTLTEFSPLSISFGSGADFSVGSISETEKIVTNIDLLNSNNNGYVDDNRKILTVSSNSGFAINDVVYQQVSKKAFTANTGVNKATGFITLGSANTRYAEGDIVYYEVAAGNTALKGLVSGSPYYVYSSNSTGLILSYPWNPTVPITNTSVTDFANAAPTESGHFFYKLAGGTVTSLGSGSITVKDIHNSFQTSGGTPNTSTFSNTNIVKYNSTTNTSISAVSSVTPVNINNQPYMSLLLRQNGYGFTKKRKARINDVISDCLSYTVKTVGVISSIGNINPGSEYNQDPYVIVYEPYVAGYGRDDYTLTISNATKEFSVGEVVYQSLYNRVYTTLELDNGIYSDTFEEKSAVINSQYDVDDTGEFIYVADIVRSFNANTDIDDGAILLSNHEFEEGDAVRYYTATGNTELDDLSNSSIYYVLSANTTAITLASTPGGTAIVLEPSTTSETGHYLARLNNTLEDGDLVLYDASGTAIGGLTDDNVYYVVDANSFGFSVASAMGGSALDLTANSSGGEQHQFTTLSGFLPNDLVHQVNEINFNANTEIADNAILLTPQPFAVGDRITYYTDAGNTAVSELGNNSTWYVVAANSTAIRVSATSDGSAIAINPTSVSETGHNILSIANGVISEVQSNSIVVKQLENTFANNSLIYATNKTYLDANVISIDANTQGITAKGVVKSANDSIVQVKRLSFEESFRPNTSLVGVLSGAVATISSIDYDIDQYPIGLNANVTSSDSVANGQAASLEIVDSGFAYSNNELITFSKAGSNIVGTARVRTSGSGIGKGYYKGTRGFLSSDNYLHDGDYYQEYSYEIFSRISVDKYSDMFKKVMHMAGTKFFGSVLIESVNSIDVEEDETSQETQIIFNSEDVESNTDTIAINNPFSNGDIVLYESVDGPVIPGLQDYHFYYVVEANGTSLALSDEEGGAPLYLASYPNTLQSLTLLSSPSTPIDVEDTYDKFITFDMDCISEESLPEVVTFTRSSTGTYFNSEGVLVTANTNEPRFNHRYNPISGLWEPAGLLIEEQRTNLIRYSGMMEHVAWTGTNSTVTGGQALAPDGTMSMALFTRGSTVAAYRGMAANKAEATLPFTFSLYVRKSVGDYCALRIQGSYPSRVDVTFDLTNGTISNAATVSGSFTNGSAQIHDLGDDLYRVVVTATSDTVASVSAHYSFNSNNTTIDGADSASNSAGYVWGAQLEQAPFPSSYIPTISAAATRASDITSVTGTNFSRWFNPNEGTFVFEADAPPEMSGAVILVVINDSNGRIVYTSNSEIRSYDGTNILTGASGIQAGSRIRVASAWDKALGLKYMSVNGLPTVSGPFDGSWSLESLLRIGSAMNNHIRRLAFYSRRLPNDQLQEIST